MITVNYKESINLENLECGIYYVEYYNPNLVKSLVLVRCNNKTDCGYNISFLFICNRVDEKWEYFDNGMNCNINEFINMFDIKEMRKLDDINFVIGNKI